MGWYSAETRPCREYFLQQLDYFCIGFVDVGWIYILDGLQKYSQLDEFSLRWLEFMLLVNPLRVSRNEATYLRIQYRLVELSGEWMCASGKANILNNTIQYVFRVTLKVNTKCPRKGKHNKCKE